MSDVEEKTLNRLRGCIKARLTHFKGYLHRTQQNVENVANRNNINIIELEARTSKIEVLLDEFNDIQTKLECLADDPTEQFLARETFENDFYETVSLAKKLAINLQSDSTSVNQTEEENSVVSANVHQAKAFNAVRLPTIQLPKFNGCYDAWLEFRDTFESLIHKNESINGIQKFHYLRAALEGDAAEVIKSFEFSAANYDSAWYVLCERFNNTQLLIHNHVKALFDTEHVQNESSIKLRKMIDNIAKHLRCLNTLNQPTKHWDALLIYMITNKLDSTTLREWEETKADLEIPTLENLTQFLRNKANLLETLESKHDKPKHDIKSQIKTKEILEKRFRAKSFAISNATCGYCQKEHVISACTDFIKLSVNERIEQAKAKKLCLNCLRTGHFCNECKAGMCKKCNSKHNTLLHFEKVEIKNSDDKKQVSLSSYNVNDRHVLLSTALIQILDKNGRAHSARALLDSGSQSSFITSGLCKKLKLKTIKVDFAVAGINQTPLNIGLKCNANIQAQHNKFKTDLALLVIPKITENLPSFQIREDCLNVPKNIRLADPTFSEPGRIDILIGADSFWNLLCIGNFSLGANKPTMQKTRFGWIISGPVGAQQGVIRCNLTMNFEEKKQLERFWEIEDGSIYQNKPVSSEQTQCESFYTETTRRDPEGRFVVQIPLKESLHKLGESMEQAKKRFLSLERKLQQNTNLRERYISFMSEYESMNHMTELTKPDLAEHSYYMPHHGVIREESKSTKLRVVFDGSAQTTTGISINDLQMIGPTIQNDLFTILLRFRRHEYAICADIEKMYRQVLVESNQRSLQRILWRPDPSEPLKVFELNTVTYGTAAASFLAIRSLTQLAIECKEEFPKIAEIIESDFYVDDLLTGADDFEEALDICKRVSQVLSKGCFTLRKWISNEPKLLEAIGENTPTSVLNLGAHENTKTLGLAWSHTNDKFSFFITEETNPTQKTTKRAVLSNIAQIFDPLGFLSPSTIIAKLILQKLWLENVSWDESLSSDLHTKWSNFRKNLITLNELNIPRHAICTNFTHLELHGFSDASQEAYGACMYLKSVNTDGETKVNLLCAKAKVAPLKIVTIPRLELCGALVLSKLVQRITESCNLHFNNVYLWCDSTIVLGWIKTPPNILKTFVGNRVAEIQDLTQNYVWQHVSSKDNPADYLSRGVDPEHLAQLRAWWHGPDWLLEEKANWPIRIYENVDLPERKNISSCLITSEYHSPFPFHKFSNLTKLKRCTAYCIRFKTNCLNSKEQREYGPLTATELQGSLTILIKTAQRETFSLEIENLLLNKHIGSKSKLLSLNPFLDNDGILRVGGRISFSDFNYDKKHPIILCCKHHLTKLIIANEHIRLMHVGPQGLLASVRETFWPIGGRNLSKRIVHDCVICFKAKPKCAKHLMGNLPIERVQPSLPFHNVGVDYAGPFPNKG